MVVPLVGSIRQQMIPLGKGPEVTQGHIDIQALRDEYQSNRERLDQLRRHL